VSKFNNAIIGCNDHLLNYLNESLLKAKRVRFIVSFLLESGAKLISRQLQQAASKGVPIQILTGRYLSITEPSAIYHLFDTLGENLEIRFFTDNVRSFHPKAYLFDYTEDSEIYIGSSNISYSALTWGVEWNYRLLRSQSPADYDRFSETFNDLFLNHAEPVTEENLKQYALNWRKSSFSVTQSMAKEEYIPEPEPIGAQVEALYYLNRAREEGITKGLVVAATGVGKTYLSAFDSAKYRRVLFIAHREEILKQAEETFRTVQPSRAHGRFYGGYKDTEPENIYASIQSISRENHARYFAEDSFDYIVIDEFHHAAANSYLKVLQYFKPRFLLGLTATPYRTDNRDIYSICDDNVIYEIYLKDAINRGLLIPFRYFGIYDQTDYNTIEQRNGQYVIEQLERELSRKERASLILDNYKKLAGKRTLGFCTSILHADYMAQYFSEQGIKAASVHSGPGTPNSLSRDEAITKLIEGEISVIFAVDIFNEGVDIPELDTVMFLRPTESFTVFLQQLGRGLRKAEGKKYLTVLDFIGNYKRAHYIPALLAGENPMVDKRTGRWHEVDYPDGCDVQFDFRIIDLFETMARNDPLKKRMENDYFRLKDELNRRPTRVDIYEGSDIPIREYLKEGWLRFLYRLGQLDSIEESWLDTPAEDFLRDVEKTAMTKAYKIPTIGAFLEGAGGISRLVPLETVGRSLMKFYKDNKTHQKDLRDKVHKDWPSWDLSKFTELARKNPVYFLSKGKFFHYDEINRNFYLDDSLSDYLGFPLANHIKDILEYRRIDYFRKRFREEG
jgi:superfamily II DNA or RNA helicase